MGSTEAGSAQDHRGNNFDFLRLLAAVMVLFSHCFPIAGIPGLRDPLGLVTINDEVTFGKVGVSVFFLISGYLISQSYERSSGILRFWKARFLRIFPGLLVVLLVSAYLIGPLVTTLSPAAYFSDPAVHAYARTVFLFPIYWELPGTFPLNHYKAIVNGSLWSIPFEFLCYVLVALLGVLRLHNKRFVTAGLVLASLLFDFSFSHFFGGNDPKFGQISIYSVVHTCFPFLCGMMFYGFRDSVVYRPIYSAVAVLVLYFCSFFGGMYFACCLAGGYLLFYYAFHGPACTHGAAKYGDLSYGVYLYSFPIQQVFVHLNGGLSGAYSQFFVTLPVSMAVAWVSWHLVEKQALNLKNLRLIRRSWSDWPAWAALAFLSVRIERVWQWMARRAILLSLVAGLLASVGYAIYIFPPSRIEFPSKGDPVGLSGGWLPQDPGENYRWVHGTVNARLYAENPTFLLVVKGFVPESFKNVNSMRVLINGTEVAHYRYPDGGAIDVALPLSLGESNHKFTVSLEFNDYFHPGPDSPEKRMLSAIISRVSVN